MNKGHIYETIINMSGNVDPSVKKGIEEVQKRLDGINVKALAVGAAFTAVGVGIATAGIKASKYLTDLGNEYNEAMNKLQAQTGATELEMQDLSSIARDIYKNNYGENISDVASSIAEIHKTTQLMNDDLEAVTEGALTLRDTFGYDVTESARAAKAMMTNFGISGEESLSMIAAGSQNGLDYSGELIDSINEYSVQFKKLGFTADDMFNIFQEGAESGAWNLDKVGDAVKEFSIRSIDGSKTTEDAYTQLGYNADEMMSIFANGGEDASEAFQILMKDLMNIEDPVKRDAIGVELMGTMWEDLGTEAVSALSDIDSSAYDTNDALKGIQEVQFNDLGSVIEGLQRKLEVGLTPVASNLASKLMELSPQIEQSIEDAMPYIQNLADNFVTFLAGGIDTASNAVKWLSENIDIILPALKGFMVMFAVFTAIKMVTGIYDTISAFKGLQDGAVSAFKSLSISKLKDKADTLYLMALYAKDAIVRGASTVATVAHTVALGALNVVTGIATALTTALGAAIAFLTSPIGIVVIAITALIAIGVLLYKNWDTVKEKAAQLGTFLSGVWSNIKTAVGNLVSGIKDTFVTGFSALAGLLKAPINAVISLINGAIGGINTIGFDVPDWVPLVGGKSFSVDIPQIPMLAKGGFTNGMSIAGEAGTEAVLSFDPSVREENLSYWAKAGRMLGADTQGYSLSDDNSIKTTFQVGEITFAPKIEITGNADKMEIIEAIEAEYPEFVDMLERWFSERGRFVFAD